MIKKYIFISGAAGGIGKVTTQLLAENGFYVFAADVNQEIFTKFSSRKIIPLQVDITDISSIQSALDHIQIITDQLYGLINVAGIFDQFPLVEASHDRFEKLIKTNVTGHQAITGALFPLLHKGKGRVINISSETVLALMPLQSYAFSKKLFDTWNSQLRMELNLLDIKVIAIRAGGHLTPFIEMSSRIIGKINEKSLYHNLTRKIKTQGQKILNKTKADPADVAKVIYKALTIKRPKNVYHVHVSLLFKILSVIPARIREAMVRYQLKKWM